MCPSSSSPEPISSNGDRSITLVEAGGEECGKSKKHGEFAGDGAVDDQELERASASKKLTRAVAVCFLFMLLEIVGGSLAGSLAILSDAAHLLSDVAGLGISLLALRASQWSATSLYSYGYLRLEVIGALVSVQMIWAMTGYIVYEAVQRPYLGAQHIDGRLMCIIAALGVVANFMMIFLLGHDHEHGGDGGHVHSSVHHHHHELRTPHFHDGESLNHKENHVHRRGEHQVEDSLIRTESLDCSHESWKQQMVEDEEEAASLVRRRNSSSSDDVHQGNPVNAKSSQNLNLRGAYLHVVGDLIQSVGVLITGIIIWVKPEWQFIDPLCSFLFSVVVLSTTVRMVRDVLSVLMESTPGDVDVAAVETGLLAIQGVDAVRQLHVWALTTGTNALTCHLHIKLGLGGAQAKDVLRNATRFCKVEQKMKFVTIQLEDALFSEPNEPSIVRME
ncbi:hypothetical protein R1flu_023794 [Riccia fluitans]|uniref:Zinc transporter n=1 Tax=Riccia fluitans TaxID=41844 RepID=A0ABD1XT73_9MARC